MILLLAMEVPLLNGYKVALFKREHEITPFVLCGATPTNEPMMESGFECFTECDDHESVVFEASNRCIQTIIRNQ